MAAAGTSSLAHTLGRSVAHAQDGDVPKRLLLIFSPHGTSYPDWQPKKMGSDFELVYPDSILAPLAPLKNKICVVEGLDMLVAYRYGASGHEGGLTSLFTGTHRNGDDTTDSPSVDQAVADHLAQTASPVPHRALNYVVGLDATWGGLTSAFFEQQGNVAQPIPCQSNTLAEFHRLFDGVTPDGPSPEQLALIARKKSLLDGSRAQLDAIKKTLGSFEKAKLDAHAEAIAQLEKRLDTVVSCSPPGNIVGSGDVTWMDHSAEQQPQTTQEFFDLITQAFACRLTHVAGLQIGFSGQFGPFAATGFDGDAHEDLAHQCVVGGVAVDPSDPTSPGSRQAFLDMQRTYTAWVMNLLEGMDAIVEENGKTLLDNTLVVWASCMGDPSLHSNCDIPIVLAGGAGRIEMGRYLQYEFSQGSHNPHLDGQGSAPHNHLLASICNVFDMGVSGYGDPNYSGTLAGL
ncbi:MAG: DUF1552 domain-containing protein [Myxococcales bacterium]|nr:DUF1552 domain-containing protein [Myxococcales bacterium]